MQKECEDEKGSKTEDKPTFKGLFMITTIQPSNIYKKILAQCAYKTLDRSTCHFLNAFNTVEKHNLFDCKSTLSIKLLSQMAVEGRVQSTQNLAYKNKFIRKLRMQQ